MKYINVCFLLIFSLTIQAKIIESDTLKIILDLIEPGTLVVFDIDNTLARVEQELGSDEWFFYNVAQKVAAGENKQSAINSMLPLFNYIQCTIPLILTESIIPEILRRLTQQSIYTMGLTARGIYLAERTHDQLSDLNIRFNVPCTEIKEFILPTVYPCLYRYQTLFISNDNDKGTILFLFLDTIDYHPKQIIFIDDKMYHVQSVETASLERNIPCIGIRYSRCDEYIENFDIHKADEQLEIFKKRNRNT